MRTVNTLIAIVPKKCWKDIVLLKDNNYTYREIEVRSRTGKTYELDYKILKIAEDFDGYNLYLELHNNSIGSEWSFGIVNCLNIFSTEVSKESSKERENLRQLIPAVTEPSNPERQETFYLTFKAYCHEATFINKKIFPKKTKKTSFVGAVLSLLF